MIYSAPYRVMGGDMTTRFHPEHLADLRASGLNDEAIQAGGVYSLAPRFIDSFFRGGVPGEIESALCFPYQGSTFARIKLFPALGKMKYAQPPRTGARLYMPFPVDERTLYVVEGEKKTLAAYQHGLNAVGIGGVWNWISKGSPINDLSLIDWEDRDVVVIPDSDVFERPDLLRAIYALGRELRNQGASVQIAQIPHGEAKVGLDDYLMPGGDVQDFDTFTLDQRVFRSCRFWYGAWRIRKAMAG